MSELFVITKEDPGVAKVPKESQLLLTGLVIAELAVLSFVSESTPYKNIQKQAQQCPVAVPHNFERRKQKDDDQFNAYKL